MVSGVWFIPKKSPACQQQPTCSSLLRLRSIPILFMTGSSHTSCLSSSEVGMTALNGMRFRAVLFDTTLSTPIPSTFGAPGFINLLSDLPPSLFTFKLSRPALPLQTHSQSHLGCCPRPQHRPSISPLTCAANPHPAQFLAHIRAQGWTDEPTTYHVKQVLEIPLLFSMVNWLVFNPPPAATAYHPSVSPLSIRT